MRFGTYAVSTIPTIAALGICAGTVHAEPPAREIAATGTESGISYHTVLTEASRVSTTTVSGGRFEVTDDRVVLRDDTGAVRAEVPLSYRMSNTTVHVAQRVSEDGHELRLEPRATPQEIGEMQPVDSMARLTDQINRNVVGLVVGGVLGGLLGTVLGLGFFSLITGPIGLVVGAIAGAYATGGQPFADAVTAVLNGQP
ncbi:hypothetical protein ACFYTQ_10165 [Nocardia sp. NPDC004068]|uniref:hypothetical protein n=1 Tax=Nocardia sp. NPDC004068 TaxID=3364303 RepID=UPI00367ABBA0